MSDHAPVMTPPGSPGTGAAMSDVQGSSNLNQNWEHDPLCHAAAMAWHDPECCDCDLIAKVRADEREQIAVAIEVQGSKMRALHERYSNDPLRDRESYRVWTRIYSERAQSYEDAARIARDGGSE